MNERLLQYRNRVVEYWNQFNKTQKIMFAATVVFVVLIIILLIYQFSKTEYSLAFTDLDADDSAAVMAYLEGQDIPYKLSDDGQSIGVPTTMASKVRVGAGSENLVQNGSIGFGIFRDNISSFGMTDKEFDVINKDALGGEIQKMINSYNGVKRSDVLVTLPKQSAFSNPDGEEDKAQASVVIDFKVGFRPKQSQIDSIYNLVSKSVPSLPIENISISDQNGELLPSTQSSGMEDASTAFAQQFAIKKQFNNDIENNVRQFLGRFFSPDKVVVSVVSTINFDKKQSSQKLVTPVDTEKMQGIDISLEEIQKTYSGTGGDTSGVAGTGDTDIPTYPSTTDSGNYNSEEISKTINREVNRISNDIVSNPYQVKDLTINVGIEPPNVNNPDSLTQENKDTVQRILMNIVGASLADSGSTYTDEELARKVTVFARSFDGNVVETPTNRVTTAVMWGVGGILLALAVVGVILLLRRRRQKAEEALIVPEEVETQKVEMPTIDIESVGESQVRKQLESLAKKKPEEFVNLLRTWLVDE